MAGAPIALHRLSGGCRRRSPRAISNLRVASERSRRGAAFGTVKIGPAVLGVRRRRAPRCRHTKNALGRSSRRSSPSRRTMVAGQSSRSLQLVRLLNIAQKAWAKYSPGWASRRLGTARGLFFCFNGACRRRPPRARTDPERGTLVAGQSSRSLQLAQS